MILLDDLIRRILDRAVMGEAAGEGDLRLIADAGLRADVSGTAVRIAASALAGDHSQAARDHHEALRALGPAYDRYGVDASTPIAASWKDDADELLEALAAKRGAALTSAATEADDRRGRGSDMIDALLGRPTVGPTHTRASGDDDPPPPSASMVSRDAPDVLAALLGGGPPGPQRIHSSSSANDELDYGMPMT